MITHTIVKHKPRHKIINSVNDMSVTKNFPCSLGFSPTQKEFEAYVASSDIKRGDYVVNIHVPFANSKYLLNVVINTVDTISRVPTWINGHPKAWVMMQVFGNEGYPVWIHNESCFEYRKITQAEYDLYVGPELDYIRNRIKEFQFADPA